MILKVKLQNKINLLKTENDELKKEDQEKGNIIKVLTNAAARIDETGWQTEHRSSKTFSNQYNKSLRTVNILLPLNKQNDKESTV